MALIAISDKRHVNRGRPMISINTKLRRIIINKTTRELMIKHYNKKEFEHILLFIDPEVPNTFWMRPCESDKENARRLYSTSDYTRTVSCSLLLNRLDWKSTKTESFPVTWDDKNDAAKIDLSQSQTGGTTK